MLNNQYALQNSTLILNTSSYYSYQPVQFGSNVTTVTLGGLSGGSGGYSGGPLLVLNNSAGASVNLRIGNNNASTTYSGSISGGGSITKIGTGTLTLNYVSGGYGSGGSNTYSGGTTLGRGTVVFSGSAFGSGPITFDGGTLRWASGGASGGSGGSGGWMDITSGGRTVSVNAGKSALLDTNGFSVTFTGAVSGAGGLTKLGGSTLTLGSTNTFSGATALNGGTLAFPNGALNSSSSIVFGGGTLQWASGNSQDISGKISTSGSTAVLDTNGNSVPFAQALSWSGGLTKIGNGTLTLSGVNTYSGVTTVSAGTLEAATPNALPGGVSCLLSVASGATLAVVTTGWQASISQPSCRTTRLSPPVAANWGSMFPPANSCIRRAFQVLWAL